MPTANFDIYEADGRYLAITNEVRRQILEALSEGEKQLPELVELTDKSKATLSSIHLKELAEQGLIKGRAHPEDSRKKLFRLEGSKIGSSNVPLEELREAVKEYVSIEPLAARFPLSITFDALAAAPSGTDPDSLRAQSKRLGLLVGGVLEGSDKRELLVEVSSLVEREGLADPVRLEMDNGDRMILARGNSAPREAPIERVAVLIGGFLDGVLEAQGLGSVGVEIDEVAGGDRFALTLVDR